MADAKEKKPKAPKGPSIKGNESVTGLGKAEIMRRKLAEQEKVAILIPLTPGEKEGATETVILNGYRLNIRKGQYVHVPKQVAQVIMESQQQTREAIENYFAMNAEGKSKAMKAKEISSEE